MTDAERWPPGSPLTALAARVAQLSIALDELKADLGQLKDRDAEVEHLGGHVAELTAMVAELASARAASEAEASTWWEDIDPAERPTALRQLGEWVDQVLRKRHPETYMDLRPCWFLHPGVVDDLAALRAAWIGAYREGALVTAAIEWHDRWLPGCLKRCKDSLNDWGCKQKTHEPKPPTTNPFLDSPEFAKATETPGS